MTSAACVQNVTKEYRMDGGTVRALAFIGPPFSALKYQFWCASVARIGASFGRPSRINLPERFEV